MFSLSNHLKVGSSDGSAGASKLTRDRRPTINIGEYGYEKFQAGFLNAGNRHRLGDGGADKYSSLRPGQPVWQSQGRHHEFWRREVRCRVVRCRIKQRRNRPRSEGGLRVRTERVVGQLDTVDGFNADSKIHIPLLGTLKKVQSLLRGMGMAGMADDLELRLNRSVEAAAPEAKALFW